MMARPVLVLYCYLMSRVRKVVLKEWVAQANGGYWTCWYDAVPPKGVPYLVLDSEWGSEGDCPDLVRHVYEWELASGSQGEAKSR